MKNLTRFNRIAHLIIIIQLYFNLTNFELLKHIVLTNKISLMGIITYSASYRVLEISDVEIVLNDIVYLFYCYPSSVRSIVNTREMHISLKRVYATSAVLQNLSLMYC